MKKGSLNRKNFIITSFLLILCGSIMLAIIIEVVPKFYKEKYNEKICDELEELKEYCAEINYENSAPNFDLFVKKVIKSYSALVLFDYKGECKEIPLENTKHYFPGGTTISLSEEELIDSYKYQRGEADEYDGKNIFVIDEYLLQGELISEELIFKDGSKYNLYLIYYTTPITDLSEVLIKMIPYVIFLIIVISIIASYICARVVTKPIIYISNISKRMVKENNLKLKYKVKRNDEIGVIRDSLNELTEKLSVNLDELNIINKSLEEDIIKEKEVEKKRREFFLEYSYKLNKPLEEIKNNYDKMIENTNKDDINEQLKDSLEVVEEMESIVKELLLLSKLEVDKN